MKILTGFVTVRKFNEFALPVPIQNKLIREYAHDISMTYKLPQSDIILNNNNMMLIDTINNISNNGNIGMCSIHMLPQDLNKLKKIINSAKSKNISFHFIFENKVIKTEDLLDFYFENNLHNIFKLNNKKFLQTIL